MEMIKNELSSFENNYLNGIHVSRYCASWIKGGGERFNWRFKLWLKSLVINGRRLTEDEIRFILNFAENGKLELQEHAKMFLRDTDWDAEREKYIKERRDRIEKRN